MHCHSAELDFSHDFGVDYPPCNGGDRLLEIFGSAYYVLNKRERQYWGPLGAEVCDGYVMDTTTPTEIKI